MVITYKTLGNEPLSSTQWAALRQAGWDVKARAYSADPPVWRASITGSASKSFATTEEGLAEWSELTGASSHLFTFGIST